MKNIQQALQFHHQQFQLNHHLVRMDFLYSEMAKSSNQIELAKKDIQRLAEKLIRRDYITGYTWVLGFNKKQGLHIHALFYLNQDQHETLAIMAMETLWEEITQQEGHIEELDVTDDVICYFTQEISGSLFQHGPHQCMGLSHPL